MLTEAKHNSNKTIFNTWSADQATTRRCTNCDNGRKRNAQQTLLEFVPLLSIYILCIYTCIYKQIGDIIHICIHYIHMHTHICIYIYIHIHTYIDNTERQCPSACIFLFLFTSVLPKVRSFIGHFLRLALGVSQGFTIN